MDEDNTNCIKGKSSKDIKTNQSDLIPSSASSLSAKNNLTSTVLSDSDLENEVRNDV